MPLSLTRTGFADFLRQLPRVGAYNTAIALFLTAATDHGFVANFIYSQAIGLSIFLSLFTSSALRGKRKPERVDVLTGIPFGFALGFTLGTWANGMTLVAVLQQYPQATIMSATAALFFGLIATYYFHSQGRLDDALADARAEKLLRVEQEALAARAELRLLQAQIEPHFLFNTLAVVIELVDSKPASARNMLLNLVTLLRGALANTRRESVPLSQELDLLRAYLDIMVERMGPRLMFQIDAEEDVRGVPLPPMLVQPLVENAVRHGLEPKAEGGHLQVRCRWEGDKLVIEVDDSGCGFGVEGKGGGVGLANVRERLAARYGCAALLELKSNDRGGVTARLELPVPCAS